MDPLFDLSAWREIFVRAFSELGANVAGFVPKLFGALVILLIGWALARALELVAERGLRGIGLDQASTRLRIAELLERSEIHATLSQIVGKLVFWLILLVFLVSGIEALGLSAVTATIDRLIAFIPDVIAAALIAVVGLLLARLGGTLVTSAAAAAGFESAGRIGFLAQLLGAGLALVLAVEQLGIATAVFVLPFTVTLGATAFAFGLAFALGARPIITHILAGHFLKTSLPRDVAVEIDGQRGIVQRVGAVETLLRNDERSWSVPNAQLLERVVVR